MRIDWEVETGIWTKFNIRMYFLRIKYPIFLKLVVDIVNFSF